LRRDESFTVPTPTVDEVDIPPWEVDFHSRKRKLADLRNKEFTTQKRVRLAKEPADDELVDYAISPDASIPDAWVPDALLQDVSAPNVSMAHVSTPLSKPDVPAGKSSAERHTSDRAYKWVVMGVPVEHHYAFARRPADQQMGPPHRNRRMIPNEFFGCNATERRRFFARQAQHEQSFLAPRHVFQPFSGTYTTAFTISRGRQPPFKPASQYYGPPFREYPSYIWDDQSESPPREDLEAYWAAMDVGDRVASRTLDPNCIITPRAAKTLLYACVAIRTLAGGKDRSMSWGLLDYVFADYPNYSQHNFRSRWFWMTRNHGNMVNKLQTEFEVLFLQAYEAGELPPFRLHRPELYHWGSLIEWMEENIDLLARRDSLPADRSKFDARCILHVNSSDTVDFREKYYQPSSSSIKRHLFSNSMSLALSTSPRGDQSYTYDEQVARSWLRAAVLSETVVDPETHAKLDALDNDTRRAAIRSLLDEKIISKCRPGRSPRFKIKAEPDAFKKRKLLPASAFAEAAAFKARLDAAGARGVPVDMGLRNGEMLAATEAAAAGRARAVARLPAVDSTVGAPWPRLSVWGFGEGLYEGKKADKRRFLWPVDVEPAEGYVVGQPLAGAPVPRGREGDREGWARVPYWMTLKGEFVEARWRELLMVVLTTLSMRAGSTVKALVESSGKFLAPWEVQLALDWLVDSGGAARVGQTQESGYVVKEWWWTLLSEEQTFVIAA
jgi:hypothetical protein